MTTTLAIVGAGGFGRETYDLIRSGDPYGERWRISGFIDSNVDDALLSDIGSRWLGTDEDFLGAPCSDSVLIAVGDPFLRARLAEMYEAAGALIETYTHPSAILGSRTVVGRGSILSAGAMVMNNSRVGSFVHVDRHAMVGHDSQVGDFVTLHPAAVLSGGVRIGPKSRLGTCSCVLPNVSVGHYVTIGAGSVVTSSIQDGLTVAGAPAKPLGK